MKKSAVVLNFCFPKITKDVKNSHGFIKALTSLMKSNGSINFAGYMEDEDLEADLANRMGDFNSSSYKHLTRVQKEKIEVAVFQTLKRCYKILPHSEIPIYIFIFPWFPSLSDSKLFRGVNAVAPHSSVIHFFVDVETYTLVSVKETTAHEYNHLTYYSRNRSSSYSLLEHMLMEGLAESFREDVVGGKQAPWATALTLKEAQRLYRTIREKLSSKSKKIRMGVLFGNKKYPRWMGYSIGYHLVREFRKKNQKLTWEKIETMSAKEFISKWR